MSETLYVPKAQYEAKVAQLNERIAVLTAHRQCHSAEHDPEHGRIHGYCIVCGIPWPCEYAGNVAPDPRIAAADEMAKAITSILSNWPPERDGMDYEVTPIGVRQCRAALAAWNALK